jgi:hypothetical protein
VLHNRSSPVEGSKFIYHTGTDHTGLSTKGGSKAAYPPGTKAFLYYFSSPRKPPIAGQLRLRVASSDDPASFESGSDLLTLDGQPWSRPLLVLPKNYIPLYEKLREERLVPDDLDAVLSTLSSSMPRPRSQLLYTLNDKFIVDFSTLSTLLSVITEKGVRTVQFAGPFTERRTESKPYTGAYTNHHLSIRLD